MRDLDLNFVLAPDINYLELLDLADVVDGVHWYEVTSSQASFVTRSVDFHLVALVTVATLYSTTLILVNSLMIILDVILQALLIVTKMTCKRITS